MNKIFNKLFLGLAVCGLAMTACSDEIGIRRQLSFRIFFQEITTRSPTQSCQKSRQNFHYKGICYFHTVIVLIGGLKSDFSTESNRPRNRISAIVQSVITGIHFGIHSFIAGDRKEILCADRQLYTCKL